MSSMYTDHRYGGDLRRVTSEGLSPDALSTWHGTCLKPPSLGCRRGMNHGRVAGAKARLGTTMPSGRVVRRSTFSRWQLVTTYAAKIHVKHCRHAIGRPDRDRTCLLMVEQFEGPPIQLGLSCT